MKTQSAVPDKKKIEIKKNFQIPSEVFDREKNTSIEHVYMYIYRHNHGEVETTSL